jgi:MOSC domain-containing protein YiiM
MDATVEAVSLSPTHTFSKPNRAEITLLAGVGVEGDAHAGATVRHLSRLRTMATLPNLRQVHLIHAELHDELRQSGFQVAAGQMGENITTRGLDLLALPSGTRLHLGQSAVVELTGLRTPCSQLDNFQHGLMSACLSKDADGKVIRKSGVMSIVVAGGHVSPGDAIRVELPQEPRRPLEPV